MPVSLLRSATQVLYFLQLSSQVAQLETELEEWRRRAERGTARLSAVEEQLREAEAGAEHWRGLAQVRGVVDDRSQSVDMFLCLCPKTPHASPHTARLASSHP